MKLFKHLFTLILLICLLINTASGRFDDSLMRATSGEGRGSFSYESIFLKPGLIRVKHVFLPSPGFRVIDKLSLIENPVRALIIGDTGVSNSLTNIGKVLFRVKLGGRSLYYVVTNEPGLNQLSLNRFIDRVIPDKPFYTLLNDKSRMFLHTIRGFTGNSISHSSGEYTVSYLEIHGVTKVWEQYGFTGEGVLIGLVDTGVDFAHPELSYSALARDGSGNPLLMVIDNGLTLFTDVINVENGYLKTRNLILPLYSPLTLSIYMVQLGFDVEIGGLRSLSGVYKVGLYDYFFIYTIGPYEALLIECPVLAILVDTQEPGVYDKVFFDLSSVFYEISVFMSKYVSWRTPSPQWLDRSIVDEEWFGPGKEIVSRDFDNDGYPDFTIGTIVGYYLDTIGLINATIKPDGVTLGKPALYVGWDYSGRFVALTKDYYGHGTNVASSIVARGESSYGGVRVKGVAPSAKLLVVESLWLYDALIGLLWLSGYELEFTELNGSIVLSFNPNGPRRADIVSNSWGLTYVNYLLQSFPGSDVFSFIVDDILFTRNIILNKPVTLVFAAGNEGPGYSSQSSPSTSLLSVSIGAVTSFKFLETMGLPSGGFGDVVPFSSRGPNSLGYPTPDALAVGAFDYTASRLIDNNGYGAGVSLFGGTSLATPIASGILALITQAYRVQYGYDPDAVKLKLILKNGAVDIGYNVYAQGCGLIDAYKSIKTVLMNDNLVYVDQALYKAFRENYGNLYGGLIEQHMGRLLDKTLFLHVNPGSNASVKLFIQSRSNVEAYVYELRFIKELTVFKGVYSFADKLFIEINPLSYVYSDYIDIVVTLRNSTYRFGEFRQIPIDPNHVIDALLIDWVDLDKDKSIDLNEVKVLNWDARLGVQTVLTLSQPNRKVKGNLILVLTPWSKAIPVEIEVKVIAYNFVKSTIISNVTKIHWDNLTVVNLSINVPKTITPGLREVKITLLNGHGDVTVVPATVSVPLIIDRYSKLIVGGFSNGFRYDQFSMHAPYDLMGVWECKDWRILPILINATEVSGLLVTATWNTGYSTDLSVLTLPPGGVFLENASINYFASYKLPYDTGFVYNPNLRDQLNSKLRFYIPIQWPTPLREVWLDILEVSINDSRVGLVTVAKANKPPTSFGLYRLIYAFSSFSGSGSEGLVVFRFLTVKSTLELNVTNGVNGGFVVEALFSFISPGYTPFYLSNVFVSFNTTVTLINGVESSIPVSTLIYGYLDNLTVMPINSFAGYYLDTSTYSVELTGGFEYVVNEAVLHEVNVIVVLNNYYWHSEGLYWFNPSEGRLIVFSYVYPGLASASLTVDSAFWR